MIGKKNNISSTIRILIVDIMSIAYLNSIVPYSQSIKKNDLILAKITVGVFQCESLS